MTPERALAKNVRAHRDRLRITAQQLADRIAALGGKLGRQAISKIENGERGISVDELFLLAKALDTAPLLLLFPVGTEDAIEYLPDQVVSPWAAAQWFSGEGYDGEDVTTFWAIPLYLFRRHDQDFAGYFGALAAIDLIETAPGSTASRDLKERAENALRALRRTRAEIRRHGLTPPPLADGMKYIDGHTDAATLIEQGVPAPPFRIRDTADPSTWSSSPDST